LRSGRGLKLTTTKSINEGQWTMARKTKKKKDIEGPTDITVLTGELADIDRSVDRLMEMARQSDGDKETIDRVAVRIVAATVERKRIKAINRAMGDKTLVELRMRGGPVATLVNNHDIGSEEVMAIMDIELAILAISGGLQIKPVSLELKSAGMKGEISNRALEARRRFEAWAKFWTCRAVAGDKTMAIVIAAVIEGRPFRVIEQDYNIGTGRAVKVCIRGLRDYSARCGEVAARLAQKWMADALLSFRDRSPLSVAVARAKAFKREEKL
jgi:hypothetical protein